MKSYTEGNDADRVRAALELIGCLSPRKSDAMMSMADAVKTAPMLTNDGERELVIATAIVILQKEAQRKGIEFDDESKRKIAKALQSTWRACYDTAAGAVI